MILLNFGLFWSGAKLSYLRYLTFKTLRHFHPHSRIQLFTSKKCKRDVVAGNPVHEFSHPDLVTKDYLPKLKDLNIEIIPINIFQNCFPHQQADMWRWIFLKEYGGIYLDPDQIILRSFEALPLKQNDFMYSAYDVDSPFWTANSEFCPIGVLGSKRESKAVNYICKNILSYFSENNYNAIGVIMMADVLKKIDLTRSFNAPSHYFYPADICDKMQGIYDGSMAFKRDTFAVHWYGGYQPSQNFNKGFTEEFAQTSRDSISTFLRKSRLI